MRFGPQTPNGHDELLLGTGMGLATPSQLCVSEHSFGPLDKIGWMDRLSQQVGRRQRYQLPGTEKNCSTVTCETALGRNAM